MNVTLSKTTLISEHVFLQLRAEAFSATGTQDAAGNSSDTTLTSAIFGASGAVNARKIQRVAKRCLRSQRTGKPVHLPDAVGLRIAGSPQS
ncbi:MAG TPA: hypothetical protein VHD85_13770 [Terracidiphilus sp.]|nr:hypothetical protein [Terracidiphilus sp.]